MKKVVWMFSGQGSQYLNMGRDLYDSDVIFRGWMDKCDAALRRMHQRPFLDAIFGGSESGQGFSDIIDTHPGLFCIQFSLAQTLLTRNLKPDLLLGYSLGEVVSAAVGEALDFETILRELVEQAHLFKDSLKVGAMLAILDSPQTVDLNDPMYAETWIAAVNLDRHFVLSGSPAAIERVERHLQTKDVLTQRLPVAIAFHSPHLDGAEQTFKARLGKLEMRELRFPLISASHVGKTSRVSPEFFWKAVRGPVRFKETIEWLEAQGEYIYVDLGPSGTLATLLKHGLRGTSKSTVHPLMTPFKRTNENLRRLEEVLCADGVVEQS